MATWKAFEDEASDLAAAIRKRFEAESAHVLATVRKDGSPRVSGSEVDFRGPDLSFGSMLGARKARDLQLTEAALTAVEGDELVVTLWRPGEGVKEFRRQ